MIIISGC
jgi:PAS domain-containing protein